MIARAEKGLRILAGIALALSLLAGWGCGGGKKTSWPVAEVDGSRMAARAQGRYLEIYNGEDWERQIIKGVNIGSALPGKWFSEFPADKGLYLDWFARIEAMHANTVRVYTLLDPLFYQALDEFNRSTSGEGLRLLQEIWPDDDIPGNNLYDSIYTTNYREEIARDLDALHGGCEIPERKGRAWGKYTADVLPYLLGVIIGREISAEEVLSTNLANPDKGEYDGRFVRASGASATEAWMAESCDYAASYVRDAYGWQIPVSFVSWPTLDPMNHPTEHTPGVDKSQEADDSQVLDPARLEVGPESTAGLFGTYHIYPYYPEFMYREPGYADYTDEEGVLRYGGYLRQFMSVHPPYPALVGEFGLSTSIGAAHIHPEGINHGAVSEEEQGKQIARMMRAIVREGYAGGMVFEWADEWAKRTWITMPYMIPFDRHIYWHNLMDPEQNFGILACEPNRFPFSGGQKEMWRRDEGSDGGKTAFTGGFLSSLSMDSDEAFVYLKLELARGAASSLLPGGSRTLELMLGIDTLGKDSGTTRLPLSGLPDLPKGVEFLLRISPTEGARLLARPDYNLAESRFAAAPATDDTFTAISLVTNRRQVDQFDGTEYPEVRYDAGALRYGVFDSREADYDSLAHWYVDEANDNLYVRLPWALLNVSDPSSATVIHDPRSDLPAGPSALRAAYGRDALRVEKSGGFCVYAAVADSGSPVDFMPREGAAFSAGDPYTWEEWEEPRYGTRLKKSYQIIAEAFGGVE